MMIIVMIVTPLQTKGDTNDIVVFELDDYNISQYKDVDMIYKYKYKCPKSISFSLVNKIIRDKEYELSEYTLGDNISRFTFKKNNNSIYIKITENALYIVY